MASLISWNSIMNAAMKMPGARVSRASFLRSEFSRYGNVDELLNKTPGELYSADVLEEVAKRVKSGHITKVTTVSAIAGVPGGLAMLGTVPIDTAQYFWHILVLSQKLAYIYGWPDFDDCESEFGTDVNEILTLFVGAGFGDKLARDFVKKMVLKLTDKVYDEVAILAARVAMKPIVKKTSEMLGVKIASNAGSKTISKIVPLLGGLVSGGVTYASFKPLANKLHTVLRESAPKKTTN